MVSPLNIKGGRNHSPSFQSFPSQFKKPINAQTPNNNPILKSFRNPSNPSSPRTFPLLQEGVRGRHHV